MNIETESLLSLSVANLPPFNEMDRIMIIIFDLTLVYDLFI